MAMFQYVKLGILSLFLVGHYFDNVSEINARGKLRQNPIRFGI